MTLRNELSRKELLRSLSQQIRQLERSRCRSHRESEAVTQDGVASLLPLLGTRTPPSGCLIEWLAEGSGAGVATLAWLMIRSLKRAGVFVVIDSRRELYAPGLVPLGVDLRRVVVLQPETPADALWALEQSLRTRGVGGVLCEIERLSASQFRRLQLAAETGETWGMLLRPAHVRRQPAWAETRLLVTPQFRRSDIPGRPDGPGSPSSGRRWRVEVLRAKGQFSGGVTQVELSDEPDRLRLVSELASATPAA